MSWDLMGCELGDGRTAVKHLIGFQKMSIVNCHVEPLGPRTISSRGKEAIPDSAIFWRCSVMLQLPPSRLWYFNGDQLVQGTWFTDCLT